MEKLQSHYPTTDEVRRMRQARIDMYAYYGWAYTDGEAIIMHPLSIRVWPVERVRGIPSQWRR